MNPNIGCDAHPGLARHTVPVSCRESRQTLLTFRRSRHSYFIR
jgi:hypothetical protein